MSLSAHSHQNLLLPPQQPQNSDMWCWGAGEQSMEGDVWDRVCCCPGAKCPMQPPKSMQPLKEWARARCCCPYTAGAQHWVLARVLSPPQSRGSGCLWFLFETFPELRRVLPRSVSCCRPRWGVLRDLAPPAAAAGTGGEGLWWKAPSRDVRTLSTRKFCAQPTRPTSPSVISVWYLWRPRGT